MQNKMALYVFNGRYILVFKHQLLWSSLFERSGCSVAVILPYEKEKAQGEESSVDSSEQAAEQLQSDELDEMVPKAPRLILPDEEELLFKRHLVDPMPADGWNDVWKQLYAQISHVEIVHPRSLANQMYPTFATAVVWGMRLILAATVYRVLDDWLYPIYKMKDPNDRPITRRPKLSSMDNTEVGALGQSR